METEPTELDAVRQPDAHEFGAYERLLGDAMTGDATLFARQDVVEAAWAIVDPVLNTTKPLAAYECGTWGPDEADRLVDGIGGWMSTAAPDAQLVSK